jgi:hypothetical protein
MAGKRDTEEVDPISEEALQRRIAEDTLHSVDGCRRDMPLDRTDRSLKMLACTTSLG